MKTTLLILALFATGLSACSKPQEDLKSPCVGTAGSPCDRRPVNLDRA